MQRDAIKLGVPLFALCLFVGASFQTLGVIVCSIVAACAVVVWSLRSAARWEFGFALAGIFPIASAVFAGLWRFNQYTSINSNPIQTGADTIAHACVIGCLVAWVFRPIRGHVAMLGAGLAAVLASIVAGGVSQSVLGQTTVGLLSCLGFMIAAETILRSRSPVSVTEASRFRLFSILVASGILAGTSLLAQAASSVLPQIQKSLQDRLNQSFESLADTISVGGGRYVRGSVLGSVRRHILSSPDEVAIRCYADSAPGYLRGVTFHRYEKRKWSASDQVRVDEYFRRRDAFLREPISRGRRAVRGPSDGALNRFVLDDSDEQRERGESSSTGTDVKVIEVHNRPEKGMVIFTSLSMRWFEAAADEIRLNADGGVVDGVNTSEPYLLGVTRMPPRQSLAPERRDDLLMVPAGVDEITNSLARQLCDPDDSPREKAAAVARYFQSTFEYSLQPFDYPRNRDPVDHFLREKKPAHCEFFATATSLILRQAGVPTRYATGYVATELSTEEDYYVARNRDAHAWVEAYDDQNNAWFAVESTPGRRYRSLAFDDELIEEDLEDFDFIDSLGAGNVGWLGRLNALLATYGVQTFVSNILRSAQLPLFFVLLGVLWYRGRMRNRLTRDPEEREAVKRLQRLDRQMKRYGLVRSFNETLHQFAARIDKSCEHLPESSEKLHQAASWYRAFAADRYRGRQPAATQANRITPVAS